jgi:hypothetical protein
VYEYLENDVREGKCARHIPSNQSVEVIVVIQDDSEGQVIIGKASKDLTKLDFVKGTEQEFQFS